MFSNIQCHSELSATCHSELSTTCHSERSEESNSAQGKLHEESQRFFVVPISSGLLRMTLPNTLENSRYEF